MSPAGVYAPALAGGWRIGLIAARDLDHFIALSAELEEHLAST